MQLLATAYVHIAALAQIDDNSCLDTQTPVFRFKEFSTTVPPCAATSVSKYFPCNKSKTGELRTLLIANLPRCASTQEVQCVFGCFSTVRDGDAIATEL